MPKQYSYQFSYYWKITWPDNATFKSDSQNYRGFKQRVKRECKIVNDDNVVLYLNLRWTTTLGKIESLFPSSTSIEASSADEFKVAKDMKETKPVNPKKIYKLKRTLEPSEEYSYCIQELSGAEKARLAKAEKKRTLNANINDEEPSSLHHSGSYNIEPVKKKIHTEEDSRSTDSTDDDARSQKNPDAIGSPVKDETYVNNVSDSDNKRNMIRSAEDEAEFESLQRMRDGRDDTEFRWENGFFPHLNLDINANEYQPKKIRNFELENSINPIYWEYEMQDKFHYDLF